MTMTDDIAKLAQFGRGGSRLHFTDLEVTKEPASLMEPLTIKAFPQVFVPILRFHPSQSSAFVMPRMLPSTVEQRRTALMAGCDKLKLLWQQPNTDGRLHWRPRLYQHLTNIASKYPRYVPHQVAEIVSSLPEPDRHVHIHGDATLANLIKDQHEEWFWIDPLDREFIPGDPHVDLGKMLQSCMGYEDVLVGNPPTIDRELARQLARHANLSFVMGIKWLTVHIVRLIPYQDDRVKEHYASVLKGMGL